MVAFCLTVQKFNRLLEVSTVSVSRFQNAMCWTIPEKIQTGKRAKMVKDP